MSCENFGSIQFPDNAGFDAQRTAHIWKILVDPEAKTLNPPEGKGRDFKGGAWRLAKINGKPYIDLMWSCGRTSWGDGNMAKAGGCHSPVLSQLPKELHFTNQKMIYDKVVAWQKPVKDGLAVVKATLAKIHPAIAGSKMSKPQKAEAQLMVNQAQDIIDAVEKDGSWGVHAPDYTLQKVKEAKTLADGAQAALAGKTKITMK
jgi:hypothetical protein